MKIAYLSASGELGGSETALLAMLKGVRHASSTHELHVIAAQNGPLLQQLSAENVSAHVLDFPVSLAQKGESRASAATVRRLALNAVSGLAAARYGAKLRKLLSQIGPDLVHSNGIKMHLLSAWSMPGSTPLIWHVHDYVNGRRRTRQLLRASCGRVAAAITNSFDVSDDLRMVCPKLPSRTIYNAVDTERFSPTGPALDLDRLCNVTPAPTGTVRVGLIATFAKWKGHRAFLKALALLNCQHPIRGYVIGGPIYQTKDSQCSLEELKKSAIELGLENRVGFSGFVQDVPAAIRSLDIVVHASTEPEPFGMVLLEAMACSKPVIVSFAGGAREVAGIHRDNPIHQPGDFAQLAAQIESLAMDPLQRAFLGKRGRAQVIERFSAPRLGAELIAFYDELLQGKASQALCAPAPHGWPSESEGR